MKRVILIRTIAFGKIEGGRMAIRFILRQTMANARTVRSSRPYWKMPGLSVRSLASQ